MVIRFAIRNARDLVYRSRLELKKQQSDIICINEDLPKEMAYIFSLARKLCNSEEIHHAWTSAAVLYIRRSGDKNSQPTNFTAKLLFQVTKTFLFLEFRVVYVNYE